MRSTAAGELTTLAGVTRRVTFRVEVENGSGTMKDLSTWVESVEMNLDVDQPVSGCTVTFRRDSGATLSLSPLRTDSTLNRLDNGITYSPQLDIGRDITVHVATTDIGATILEGDYKFLFSGQIDLVNFEQSPVSVACRDKAAYLVDRWVEVEQDYGSVPGVALEVVMQTILDAHLGGVTLTTPVSPSYLISPVYRQQRMSLMDALTALAQLPGWDVRYKWSDGASNFLLTLSEPDRDKVIPDYTFAPSTYFDVRKLELDLAKVRNAVRVTYHFQGLWVLGNTIEDADSIAKYGRRFFLIQEDSDSPINTEEEAETMANAILADLKDPKAEQEVELPFFWPAELGDLYRFAANGVHYNADEDLAVVSIRHEISRERHRTTLTLRGKPIGGYLTWLSRPTIFLPTPGVAPVAIITPLNTEVDRTVWNFRFDAIPGSGGGGANLTYSIIEKLGNVLGETTRFTGDATTLPRDVPVKRLDRFTKVIRMEVTDVATGLRDFEKFPIPSREIPTGGDSGQTEEEGRRSGWGGIPVPSKAFHALPLFDASGSNALIDTEVGQVGSTLKANDGEAGIESQRSATKKGARAAGSGANGITGEEDTRGGGGGIPVPFKKFITEVITDYTGSLPLIDTFTRRFQSDLLGPTGIGGDVIERGGSKGDQAIDSGISIVDTAIDFFRGFVNKHLGNIPDDATSDRRAATLNQKTGGDRGAAAIDSGNIIVTTAWDGSRAYVGKHLGNIPDDATSDRRAATADEKTGATRGFTALDVTNKLVTGITAAAKYADGATGIDSLKPAEAGANVTETRTSADTAAVDGTAAATVKGGAVRANTGLDATGKLQTGVTPGATAPDGEAPIESQRASTRKAAQAAGTGAQGITEEEWIRGGCGGSPVPGGRVFTLPVFSSDGGTPLLDTVTRTIMTGLKYADGVTGIDALKPAEASANRVHGLVSNKITSDSTNGRNRCKVTLAANMSTSSTSTASVTWDAEAYDIGTLHDNATNNTRITVPAGGGIGVWILVAQIQWDANGTGQREVLIRKNGSTFLALNYAAATVSGSSGTTHSAMAFDDAPTAGDYYEVRVWQNSGGNLDVVAAHSFFSATHLW